MSEATPSVARVVRAGALAGIVGAVTLDAYLLLIYVVLGRSLTTSEFFRRIAAGAIGRSAGAAPAAPALGVAIHLLVSLAWGIGFAYVAARTPQVLARPLTSGLIFGLVVLVAMQLIEVAGAIWTLPSDKTIEHQLVAHLIFFGLPVAYLTTRELRRP